jgi:hypothetical protein
MKIKYKIKNQVQGPPANVGVLYTHSCYNAFELELELELEL